MLRARLVVFVLAATLAVPAIASAQVVVGLYPVQGKLKPELLADAESLIASGVRSSDRRRGTFILRGPVPLKAACAAPATTECLAGLGRGGAILYAEAAMDDGAVNVTLSLITGEGLRTQPVRFRFMPGFLDLRPAQYAVEQLEKALAEARAGAAPVASSAAPARPRALDLPMPPPPAQKAKPVAAAPQASAEVDSLDSELAGGSSETPYDSPKPGASGWMRKTGIYTAIGGAAILGAGGFFGLRSRGMSADLTRRYSQGLLVPEDGPKYGQVKTYNTLANTMLIGGGVLAATGLTFWGLSYVSFDSDGRGGGRMNVGGRW